MNATWAWAELLAGALSVLLQSLAGLASNPHRSPITTVRDRLLGVPVLATGPLLRRLRADFYIRHNLDRAEQRALDQLRRMGYEVTLNPLTAASGGALSRPDTGHGVQGFVRARLLGMTVLETGPRQSRRLRRVGAVTRRG